MNRIDRLYALVEELRAAGSRGRTAGRLAEHFEVSVRTIERDLSALGQAGVPLATKQGRTGGYTLDRSMSLPPLNFTPREAAAIAVALSRSEHVLVTRDARSAMQKIVAAMPERTLGEARATAEKIRLLVQPAPSPDAEIAETIWCGVRDNQVLRIRYIDVGGIETDREVDPQQVVVGPNGSYLTAFCHLRGDDRVFRMDRIAWAERTPSPPRPRRVVAEPVVDGHQTRLPESALRPEELLPNSDIGLSPVTETVGAARRPGGDRSAEGEAHDQPAPGTLAWFEVATSDPDRAEKFYGSLFDWTFEADGPAASGGMDYRNITASGADGPMGGVSAPAGRYPTTPSSTS